MTAGEGTNTDVRQGNVALRLCQSALTFCRLSLCIWLCRSFFSSTSLASSSLSSSFSCLMMRSLSAGLLFCGSECTKVSQLWEKKPKKLTRQGEFSHHEQVCVKLFKVTQAIHRWTRGVVVRQDDDIVIFRGGWALLSFDVAGYTREVPFKLIFHYNNNFACRNHQISHKASALPPQWKAEASFAHALSRIAVGLFSHMQCTAADIYCQTCFV